MSSPVGNIPQGDFLNSMKTGITLGWQKFFSDASNYLQILTTSGTTANRPTKFLFIGRPYFDTSLGAHGKPIWYTSAGWVDATSTLV